MLLKKQTSASWKYYIVINCHQILLKKKQDNLNITAHITPLSEMMRSCTWTWWKQTFRRTCTGIKIIITYIIPITKYQHKIQQAKLTKIKTYQYQNKSHIKIVISGKSIPLTHKCIPWLGRDISIQSGGVKLVLLGGISHPFF